MSGGGGGGVVCYSFSLNIKRISAICPNGWGHSVMCRQSGECS